MSLMSRAFSLFAGVMLALSAITPVQAQDSVGYEETPAGSPSAAAMTVDLIVARPLGFVVTVLGTAVFVAALPFAALAGNVGDPARKLVVEPAAFTFVRPLGEGIN